jgi:hypothetical protein
MYQYFLLNNEHKLRKSVLFTKFFTKFIHRHKIYLHMLKILLFSFYLCNTDSIPQMSRDSLFASLRNFHAEQLQADLSEFDIREPHLKKWEEWLKWVPQIGVNYTLIQKQNGQFVGQPRPTIGYNFSQVYSNLKEKKKVETDELLRLAKSQKILRGSVLAFKADSISLEQKLKVLEIVKKSISHLEAFSLIESEEFELQEKRYRNNSITPVEWGAIRLAHAKSGESLWREIEKLDLLILEIFKLARL